MAMSGSDTVDDDYHQDERRIAAALDAARRFRMVTPGEEPAADALEPSLEALFAPGSPMLPQIAKHACLQMQRARNDLWRLFRPEQRCSKQSLLFPKNGIFFISMVVTGSKTNDARFCYLSKRDLDSADDRDHC
jgi:hypothetical protein